ncbi:ABC transporter substrate-binding protein [Pusillimonas sp.]|uniref:ABC transporter substrate-binding protein n=1 Tax=Pusillimonas sp. TaxID=3040095 RepID=UPI0029BB4A1D|nr:ABC transporter substrate-binding protein [Pusillimonas sp.]MDX3893090.1 ABC transporter substrate-binding protein [Pusillimonas sp.]
MKKLLTAVMLGACVSMAAAPSLAADKLESITYLLPAPKNLPAFAPWLIAQQQGYFKDEGLDVTFVSGKGGVDVAKQVGAGNAPIGGAIGDTPIIVRANGVPVKAVALMGAGSLTLIASHENAPIDEPEQLKGKTITVMAYTDTTYYSLLGTMQKAKLTRNDAEIQAAGPAGVWQLFASNKADAMAAVPDWVATVRQNGGKVHLMDPAKGFNSMAQAMIASDDTIKNNPQLIQRIVRATVKGMELIMKDPETALKAYIEAVPAHKERVDEMREVFRLYNKYVYANQAVPGKMDPERLAAVQDFYVAQGIVDKAAPVEELYTNQFIEASQ